MASVDELAALTAKTYLRVNAKQLPTWRANRGRPVPIGYQDADADALVPHTVSLKDARQLKAPSLAPNGFQLVTFEHGVEDFTAEAQDNLKLNLVWALQSIVANETLGVDDISLNLESGSIIVTAQVILTSLDDLHNWARLSSLWPLLYGTACCFIEALLKLLGTDLHELGLEA